MAAAPSPTTQSLKFTQAMVKTAVAAWLKTNTPENVPRTSPTSTVTVRLTKADINKAALAYANSQLPRGAAVIRTITQIPDCNITIRVQYISPLPGGPSIKKTGAKGDPRGGNAISQYTLLPS
jgi:hypothetical protein